MQPNVKLRRYAGGIGNLRGEDMNLMPAPDHFFHQINRLRRSPARRRKERLVRQKGYAQGRVWFHNEQTLFNFDKRLQSQFHFPGMKSLSRRAKSFDNGG